MGGSIGKAITKVGSGITKASTLGLSDKIKYKGRSMSDWVGNPIDTYRDVNNPDAPPTAPADPLEFNAEQAAKDMADIKGEGLNQYGETMGAIDQYGKNEDQRAKALFGSMLPDIAENAQVAHLYDSTGYGQEVARQQSGIASQISQQEDQQRLAALAAKQGFDTGAIQREMSLSDFTNQARVAKAIGAQMMPAAPSSKATGMSGAMSGATAGSSFGPWGALIGAGAGYAASPTNGTKKPGGK